MIPHDVRFALLFAYITASCAQGSAPPSTGSGHQGPSQGSERARGSTPTQVTVTAVVNREVPVYVDGLGTAQALTTARVHSQVDGRIDKVHFTEGSMVHEGDPLVDLDMRPFEIALKQAEAALARDEALVRNSRLNRDRDRQLLQQSLIAKGTVTDAEALAAEGEAQVAADRAAVMNAKLQLEYAHVKAPIAGRTGVRLVDRGNLVHASDSNALVVITQMDPIVVLSTLAEKHLPTLLRAQSLGPVVAQAVSQDGTRVQAEGVLSLIDNQINTSTGTLTLKSTFANGNNTLWPGQFVRTRFIIDTLHNALMVPEEALVRGEASEAVFVLQPGGDQVQMRKVVAGLRTGGMAHITQGLAAQELVVTEGQFRLRDGAFVRITK